MRRFREDSGNAGMVARELPSDEVLASWQHVEQRALDLRAAGMPGTLQELRVRAYLDLLQERDSRDQPAGPRPLSRSPRGRRRPRPTHRLRIGSDRRLRPGSDPAAPTRRRHRPRTVRRRRDPAPSGPASPAIPAVPAAPVPRDGPGGPGPVLVPLRRRRSDGPSLAALVTITVPWATVQGQSETPGEAAGFGVLDGDEARDLVAAAARHPRTRWCVTALNPDGTAAAHGCLPGRHPPPGTGPPGSPPALTIPHDPGRPRPLRPRPRRGRLPPQPQAGRT